MTRIALTAVSALILAGCADGAEAARAAGDTAIGQAAPSDWRVDVGPTLTLGALDGDAAYQFEEIADARRADDGRIVVADRGAAEIRIFDPAGRHLRTLGGKGGGPGEFASVSRIFLLPGDTIAVWDARHQRLTVFSPGGAVARTEPLELPGMGGPVDALFPDGSIVARPGIDGFQLIATGQGERRLPVTHLLRAPGDQDWRALDGFMGREEVVSRADRSVALVGVLFGRDHVAAGGRNRWYTGDTGRFEITVRAADGSELHVLRRDHTPRPVTDDVLDRARADHQASGERSDREMARVTGARPEPTPLPPHRDIMPAFDQIVEDALEHVWVRHYQFPRDAPQRWSVFSPTGQLIAEAETPAGLRVLAVGADWVMGTARAELGVPYVHVHALERR